MLIQTLPPRRMCRVMAIRALSICRLVTYAGSRAWMPHSPNVTAVPPLAAPDRSGWCCLRCLTRRGMSMRQPSDPWLSAVVLASGWPVTAGGAGGPALPPARPPAAPPRRGGGTPSPPHGGPGGVTTTGGRETAGAATGAAGTALAARRTRRGVLLAGELALGDVALVDPHLDADAAERRAGLVQAVVDVRAQRVQGDAALAVELRTAHLGAAETAGALHPDALGAGPQRRLHALAHGTAERHTAGELLGDALGDELRVHLGVAHLEDVQLHLLARELLELGADAVGLGAAAADDDAGTRGVDVDAHAVTGALDLDAADARALHALRHELADRHVLLDVVAVPLARPGAVGEPPALVLGGDAQPEPVRVDLLPH